ncbi:MAG: hypothetical protein B7Y78_13505, partial [Caulobacter sp. 35-67-4]
FVYLAAFRAGMTPEDMIDDTPITTGSYRPANHGGKYRGRISLRQAFAASSNVAAVRLTQKVGVDNVIKVARDLGVTAPLTEDLSLALGTSEIPLIELAEAYAAVAAGSSAAMNDLGALYSAGDGTPQDDAEALKLFIAAARNGSAIAMANVAVVHYNGEGVPVDYVEAIRWYQLAADHGYLPAYYRLGAMCEAGQGVPYDLELALGLYRRAAESDDPALRQKAHTAIDRLERGDQEDPRVA